MKKQESRMRRRQVKEGGRGKMEFYVDRDRAAGVAMGSKDIKRQMRKIGDTADILPERSCGI